jgi:hypothetical protein
MDKPCKNEILTQNYEFSRGNGWQDDDIYPTIISTRVWNLASNKKGLSELKTWYQALWFKEYNLFCQWNW